MHKADFKSNLRFIGERGLAVVVAAAAADDIDIALLLLLLLLLLLVAVARTSTLSLLPSSAAFDAASGVGRRGTAGDAS